MKIIAIREKFDHISTHSGYDTLYRYLSSQIEIESIFCNFKKIYKRGIGRLMLSGSKLAEGTSFYNAQSFEAETKLFLRSPFNKPEIIHYSHGEPYFGLGAKYRNRLSQKIILTNHQPVTWWRQQQQFSSKFSKADSIIVLSEYDRDYFSNICKTNVVYIPHGVDAEFYQPNETMKSDEKFKVLFSGRYLRDVNTLAKLIKRVDQNLAIEFVIIYYEKSKTDNKNLLEIVNYKNVRWLSNLSEEQYLAEYQRADCCLIPLEDSTANNAILEAMSCGLPIISTNLPPIKSYLKDDYSILAGKENVDELYDALLHLFENRNIGRDMGKNARLSVLNNFDWKVVAKQTLDLFNSVKNDGYVSC